MRKCNLFEIQKATSGTILSQNKTDFSGLGTDTRKDLTGQIFWVLKGESFDAHDFLDQAASKGASGLVVESLPQRFSFLKDKVSILQVQDSLLALQDFAAAQRKNWGGTVIAITGSNGKTTSKEFAQAVLQTTKKVHSNPGSFNNHFGLPFNLLAAPLDAEIILAEMGMNHAGEIARLCEIASPDVVVCSMVGRAHIEHFGSVDKIAEAKEEIYLAAPENATRIFNLDNPWTQKMYEHFLSKKSGSRVLTFSQKQNADVVLNLKSMSLRDITVTGQIAGVIGESTIPVFGVQNLINLSVAASCGLAVNMTPAQIWAALPSCKTNWGRNQFVQTKVGAEILFDAYNANPDSMQALLENISLLPLQQRKVGVFAEMLEMGDHSEPAHKILGENVGRAGFDCVYFYGKPSAAFAQGVRDSGFSKKLFISDTYEEGLASEVANMLQHGDLVLVKGSRGMKLERFVLLTSPLNFTSK